MLNVRSLMHVLRTSSNVCKTGVSYNICLSERALTVHFEKNYSNAWVVLICKHKVIKGW